MVDSRLAPFYQLCHPSTPTEVAKQLVAEHTASLLGQLSLTNLEECCSAACITLGFATDDSTHRAALIVQEAVKRLMLEKSATLQANCLAPFSQGSLGTVQEINSKLVQIDPRNRPYVIDRVVKELIQGGRREEAANLCLQLPDSPKKLELMSTLQVSPSLDPFANRWGGCVGRLLAATARCIQGNYPGFGRFVAAEMASLSLRELQKIQENLQMDKDNSLARTLISEMERQHQKYQQVYGEHVRHITAHYLEADDIEGCFAFAYIVDEKVRNEVYALILERKGSSLDPDGLKSLHQYLQFHPDDRSVLVEIYGNLGIPLPSIPIACECKDRHRLVVPARSND